MTRRPTSALTGSSERTAIGHRTSTVRAHGFFEKMTVARTPTTRPAGLGYRTRLKARAILACLACLAVVFGHARAGPARVAPTGTSAAAKLALLIEQWHHRDAVSSLEIGRALSESFVVNEMLFLQVMNQHPAEWRSWLAELPAHTFTASDRSQTKPLRKLRRDMLRLAGRLQGDRWVGDQAKALASSLQAIEVRAID